jgi:hypothetical protein
MKKGIKIFLWITLVLLIIVLIFCASLNPEVPCSDKDIVLYRLAGSSLLAVWIIGVLIELDIFHIKKNIPLVNSNKTTRHIAFWCILIVFSIILFNLFYGCTSEQFKKAMEEVNGSTTKTDVTETLVEKNDENSQSTQTINEEQSNIVENITNTDKEQSEFTTEKQATYLTSENPVLFENFETIDCDGVDFTIDRLKVCADLDNPKSGFNYYYIVYEYTVKNNNKGDITWQIGSKGNGNIYGTFIYESYERSLGGNQFIKDEDITSKWISGGGLSEGEKKTCSMTLIVQRTVDDPEEGLMLKTDSHMQVVLPVLINGNECKLTFTLN